MRRPLLVVLTVLCVTAGCDRAEVLVQFRSASPVTERMLRLRITAPGETWEFKGQRDAPTPQEPYFETGLIQTPEFGTMTVSYALCLPSGDTISAGSASVELKSDLVWAFTIMPLPSDRAHGCMGCGSAGFPLDSAFRNSPSDSVWITWGSNSIKNPVVF